MGPKFSSELPRISLKDGNLICYVIHCQQKGREGGEGGTRKFLQWNTVTLWLSITFPTFLVEIITMSFIGLTFNTSLQLRIA